MEHASKWANKLYAFGKDSMMIKHILKKINEIVLRDNSEPL